MATVYVETTVIGHLAGRLHADPIIAARQVVTRRCEVASNRYAGIPGLNHPLSVRPKNWPENMMPDSPTDEIRAIRHELAAKFDNDIKRIGDDLRFRQQASGCEYIRLPKRIPHSQHTANQTSHAPTSRE